VTKLRVSLAQVDATVGDLEGNSDLVVRWTREAARPGVDLVAFPEMMLTGYPPEDLVLRKSFQETSVGALGRLARRLDDEGLGGVAVVVGYLDTPLEEGGMGGNSAALLAGGRVVDSYAKHHLPNYGVHDETRYFRRGSRLPVFELHGARVALTVCEDLWVEGGPLAACSEAGVDLVVTLNGSPYERAKDDSRLPLVASRAEEAGAPVAYVNMTGSQDEIVYEGDSLVVAPDGHVLGRAPQFVETLLTVDLDLPGGRPVHEGEVQTDSGTTMTVVSVAVPGARRPESYEPLTPPGDPDRLSDEAEVYNALVTATRDYVRKNGFRSVALGLSGGIDSAVVATIAGDALGPDAVHVVGLPSRHSSDHSLRDAEELARRQGMHWLVVPIEPAVEAFHSMLGPSGGLDGLAAENLQSRIRGTALMALSNQHGHLILTCGNKSELATGYSTLYGDTAGGYSPIKDVPKTLLYRLAEWRNADAESRGEKPPVPQEILDKAPSAELAPGQVDTDSLPDYEVLDALLEDYVVRDLGRDQLLDAGHDPDLVERVLRLVDLAEYKRRQSPIGPKITARAFGRDRRQPITSRWREHVSAAETSVTDDEGRVAEDAPAGEPDADPRRQ
jgi:NAD+ synthase (glutamine-hydrolysing)